MTGIQERLDRLESLVEAQQETIQQQRERITELDGETDSDETPLLANRRTALKAGGLAALLFGGVGTASADPQGQVGTSSDPLEALYTDTLGAGSASEVTLSDTLDLDGNDLTDAETTIWNATGSHVEQSALENESLTVAGNTVALGGSTGVPHADLDGISADQHHAKDHDHTASGVSLVPPSGLVEDSVTVTAGTGLTGGGPITLGSSAGLGIAEDGVTGTEIDLASVAGENVTVDTTNDELDVTATSQWQEGDDTSLLEPVSEDGVEVDTITDNGAGSVTMGNTLNLDGNDLEDAGTTIWDAANGYVLQGRLENESLTVAGNSVSLGGSTGISHGDLSNSNEDSHHTRPSAGTGLSDDSDKFKIVPGDFDGEYLSGSGTTLDFDGAAEWNGGYDNTASGTYATVGGGTNNTASGTRATVPGGSGNTADGNDSFAAGSGNSIGSGQNNCFVFGQDVDLVEDAGGEGYWGRSELIVFSPGSGGFDEGIDSNASEEVLSDVPIYAPQHNRNSSRTFKTNIETVDARSILTKVRNMEISKWEFIDIDTGRHIGPMAEDFHDAFAVGDDEKSIASVDADGVALAAIQGLSEQVDEKDDRIDALEAENADIRAENADIRERNEELETRLERVEAELGLDATADRQGVADD